MFEFSKETKSYELVTLLEKMKVTNKLSIKFKNLILFIIKYEKYKFQIRRIQNKKHFTNEQVLDLYIEIFKEYIQLSSIMKDININSKSKVNMTFSNNIIDCSIWYELIRMTYIGLIVQYNIIDNEYCIYIDTGHTRKGTRGYNLTDKNLDVLDIKDNTVLLMIIFFNDILYIWMEIFRHYIRRESNE